MAEGILIKDPSAVQYSMFRYEEEQGLASWAGGKGFRTRLTMWRSWDSILEHRGKMWGRLPRPPRGRLLSLGPTAQKQPARLTQKAQKCGRLGQLEAILEENLYS